MRSRSTLNKLIQIPIAMGIAAILVGGLVSFELIPRQVFAAFSGWIQWILAACFLAFSVLMAAGYVVDSGIVGRIFKKKP